MSHPIWAYQKRRSVHLEEKSVQIGKKFSSKNVRHELKSVLSRKEERGEGEWADAQGKKPISPCVKVKT